MAMSPDNYEDEAIRKLQEQIEWIELERCGGEKDVEFYRERARQVFGMMMRAQFRSEADENSKFMPCKDEVEFLKSHDPALCTALRLKNPVDFCNILHPVYPVPDEPLQDEDIAKILQCNDSIFHLHRNRLQEDLKEFKDLTLRANVLSKEVKKIFEETKAAVNVFLLDGHGRMLVCLIRGLFELGINPNDLKNFFLNMFEIDDQVHRYHQYVFPNCVVKSKKSIISNDPPERSLVYLNFCSVKSATDDEAWKDHFENQSVEGWVPHCCKEKVLKYI